MINLGNRNRNETEKIDEHTVREAESVVCDIWWSDGKGE